MEVFVNDIHSSWNYPHHDVTPWAFVYKSDLIRGSASFLQLVILVFISIRFVHMIVF